MSIPMNDFIDVIEQSVVKDKEGFGTERDVILASVRAEKSYTAMNEMDANGAAFAVQNALFKFRKIPGLTVTPSMFIADSAGRYNVISVDEMSGKGLYVIATGRIVTASE